MRDRYNTTTRGTYRSWRKAAQKVCRAGASGPDGNALTGWYRAALVVGMLAVFLTSTIAIAFDNHDFTYLKPQCSICEVKKVYKGTSKKALQDAVYPPSSFRGEGERFHPWFIASLTEHVQPLSLTLFRESDRAPPLFS